jgi:hypothetical protein
VCYHYHHGKKKVSQ